MIAKTKHYVFKQYQKNIRYIGQHASKPVLIVDDSDDSQTALKLFNKKRIDVQYHINKFAGGCCGRVSDETSTLSIVTAPAIIAPEGIFKGIDGIKNYFDSERRYYESESAYW